MPLDDPFETSEFSIAWAKDHIAELEREIDAFFNDKDAYTTVVEPNRDPTYQMVKIRFCKAIPLRLRGHASDVAIHLRNALDQAVCSVFHLAGISKNTTYFPIARSVSELEDTLTKGWCKGLPQEISDLVRRSKPYKGGNDLLWALNKLSGVNKHSILRPVVPTNELMGVEGYGMGLYFWNPPRWDSDKKELFVAKVATGTNFDIDYQTAFFIAFNEIEFIDGLEIVAVFNKMIDVVEGIVMAIKAESKRIGLFQS